MRQSIVLLLASASRPGCSAPCILAIALFFATCTGCTKKTNTAADTRPFTGPPPKPFLEATGSAELSDRVVRIAAETVEAVSDDGLTLTLAKRGSGISQLAPGKIILVPDLAVRNVETVTPVADTIVVRTSHAKLDRVFKRANIRWGGRPNADADYIPVRNSSLEGPSYQEGKQQSKLVVPEPIPGQQPVNRSPGGAFHVFPVVYQSGAPPPLPKKFPSCAPQVGADVLTQETKGSRDFKSGPLSATAEATVPTLCPGILQFRVRGSVDRGGAKASASGTVTIWTDHSSGEWNAVNPTSGELEGIDFEWVGGIRFQIDLDAVSTQKGGLLDKALIRGNLVEVATPITNPWGVPLVMTFEAPLLLQPVLTGGADRAAGRVLDYTCLGAIKKSGATPSGDHFCIANGIAKGDFISLAPSGMIVAVGMKIGLGLGETLTLKKADVFVGPTWTAALSLGWVHSGGAGGMLLECDSKYLTFRVLSKVEAQFFTWKESVTMAELYTGRSETKTGRSCPTGMLPFSGLLG